MTEERFEKFFKEVTDDLAKILVAKNADYSTGKDKLANFKRAAMIDAITPVEALRGMWLKHRASLVQGLDDLKQGKMRSREWWREKVYDSVNYTILLLALLEDTDCIE